MKYINTVMEGICQIPDETLGWFALGVSWTQSMPRNPAYYGPMGIFEGMDDPVLDPISTHLDDLLSDGWIDEDLNHLGDM